MSKRILFIISDTGGGHRSAANAIAASLTSLDPEIRFEMVDLLRASRLPGIRNAPEIYAFFSAKSIWLYNLMYRLANFTGFMNLASKFLYQFARAHIHQTIEGFKPDLVVVIHPLAVRPMCDYRDETSAVWPIVTVVTDLVSIHASWASDRADHFLLPATGCQPTFATWHRQEQTPVNRVSCTSPISRSIAGQTYGAPVVRITTQSLYCAVNQRRGWRRTGIKTGRSI